MHCITPAVKVHSKLRRTNLHMQAEDGAVASATAMDENAVDEDFGKQDVAIFHRRSNNCQGKTLAWKDFTMERLYHGEAFSEIFFIKY